MTLRLQTESPADQDMFRGSSHEKVAENVAQIIRTPDVNIIGLEGELGLLWSTKTGHRVRVFPVSVF